MLLKHQIIACSEHFPSPIFSHLKLPAAVARLNEDSLGRRRLWDSAPTSWEEGCRGSLSCIKLAHMSPRSILAGRP